MRSGRRFDEESETDAAQGALRTATKVITTQLTEAPLEPSIQTLPEYGVRDDITALAVQSVAATGDEEFQDNFEVVRHPFCYPLRCFRYFPHRA